MFAVWGLICFEVTYTAIETDAIKARLLPLLGKLKHGVLSGEGDSSKSTSGKVIGADDKLLRSCGSIAISVAVLGDEYNRRMLAGVVGISNVLLEWHQSESKECRSVEGCQQWMLKQLQGQAMASVFEIFTVLENEMFMETVGFLSGAVLNFQHMSDLEIQHENELSGLLGRFLWH